LPLLINLVIFVAQNKCPKIMKNLWWTLCLTGSLL